MATADSPRTINLGFVASSKIFLPYLRENLMEQVKSIWFIIAYLLFFQIVILGLPIVYAAMIGAGLAVVALGLLFFMEGLRLGLMPLGETIGAILPRNSTLPIILLFAFLLGLGATFAEPAIAVLKAAGGGVKPEDAPLLYALLNQFSGQLVNAVGIGVGIAVMLGVLRFFFGWSLRYLLLPLILLLCGLTLWLHSNPITQPILGLAWDCGAVTTGPVTVPLVLALGIGVCRIVGDGDSGNAGFGIVTLASLFPILAVMLLGIYHFEVDDYRPLQLPAIELQPSSPGPAADDDSPLAEGVPTFSSAPANQLLPANPAARPISIEEYREFIATGVMPEDSSILYRGGNFRLENGRILIDDPLLLIERNAAAQARLIADRTWNPALDLATDIRDALLVSLRAIIPLSVFMFITLRLVLREKVRDSDGLIIGIVFAVVGMSLFALGISMGLTPLGSQLGSNVPGTFAEISAWGADSVFGPVYGANLGKWIAVLFGFFLGYGATLAEPALNALGTTVENTTVGAFRKSLLMHSVALGVGLGIAAGVCKIAFNLPLAWMLVPPYLCLLLLTLMSSEEFVNFSWDSAGVTTGPITVPLVLAMGLGIGANIPGVIDGFGVLALASVGPIVTVLIVGLIVARYQGEAGSGTKVAASASIEDAPGGGEVAGK